MIRRTMLVVAALALVLTACSSDKGDDASSASTASTGTTAGSSGPTDSSSTPSSSATEPPASVPQITAPADMADPCTVLSAAALVTVGVSLDAATHPNVVPDGSPAPSYGCRWEGDADLQVALYYGRDPLEILAIVRQQNGGGTDVTGVGSDAYYVPGPPAIMYVDAGSSAFAVTGAVSQDQLQALAQNVITNL